MPNSLFNSQRVATALFSTLKEACLESAHFKRASPASAILSRRAEDQIRPHKRLETLLLPTDNGTGYYSLQRLFMQMEMGFWWSLGVEP